MGAEHPMENDGMRGAASFLLDDISSNEDAVVAPPDTSFCGRIIRRMKSLPFRIAIVLFWLFCILMYFVIITPFKNKLHTITSPPSGTNAANVNQVWKSYYPSNSQGLYVSVLVSATNQSEPMMICNSTSYLNNPATIDAWNTYVVDVKSAIQQHGYQNCTISYLAEVPEVDRKYAKSSLMTPSCDKALVQIYCDWVTEPGSKEARDVADTIQDVKSSTLKTESVSGVLIPDGNIGTLQPIGLVVGLLILAGMVGNVRLVF